MDRTAISHIEAGRSGTTLTQLEAWAAACGFRVELVEESDTILHTPGLTAEHRALIDRMTRVLPAQAPGETYVFDAILDAMERRRTTTSRGGGDGRG